MKRLLNFIGGEFVEPTSGRWVQHVNPATGELACEYPDSEFLDIVKSVQAANKASANWMKSEAHVRAEYLHKIANEFETHQEALARIQSEDQGMPLRESSQESLSRVLRIFRHYATLLAQETGASVSTPHSRFYSNRLPIGVVAALTPWTDALVAMAARVAPALAAGNSVILKPSEFAPETAQAFARMIVSSGLPGGVFNLVHGRGEQAGRALVQHPAISTISLMGRTETGKEVLRESADFLKRTQLLLGGRNPVLVFAETDLQKTIPQIISACFPFHGQSCLRGSRIFVQESIYKQFLELFQAEVDKIIVGDPLDEKTQIGPMASSNERRKFESVIEQASQEKGKILCGGSGSPEGLPGYLQKGGFVRPTVICDLTLCSTLQQDEILGPLVTVSSFKYLHDAIKHANNSPLGQAAFVYHSLGSKAARVAQKLEAGRIFLNSGRPLMDERMSYEGVKNSGLGRDGGIESMRFFSRETLIAEDITP